MTRGGIATLGGLGLAALFMPIALSSKPVLLWNATASAPIGLYRVQPAGALATGDWVAVRAPTSLALLFAERNYLPVGVPLVKQIAALAPQRVCRNGGQITIDGAAVGWAHSADRLHRRLPVWGGCRRLKASEVFLLNAAPDSLDSRYFGPVQVSSVIGQLTPVWLKAGPR